MRNPASVAPIHDRRIACSCDDPSAHAPTARPDGVRTNIHPREGQPLRSPTTGRRYLHRVLREECRMPAVVTPIHDRRIAWDDSGILASVAPIHDRRIACSCDDPSAHARMAGPDAVHTNIHPREEQPLRSPTMGRRYLHRVLRFDCYRGRGFAAIMSYTAGIHPYDDQEESASPTRPHL